jgi:hypothetical protein
MSNDAVEELVIRKHALLNHIQGNREQAGEYYVELEDVQTRLELELWNRQRSGLEFK